MLFGLAASFTYLAMRRRERIYREGWLAGWHKARFPEMR